MRHQIGVLQRSATKRPKLRFLRARNLQGFDVYLLPFAEYRNAGYILLDLDHSTAGVLPRMRANGHEPCVLLRTRPGHLQAWIRVSTTPLEAAAAIAEHLAHAFGRDLASTSSCHLGRLAGFTNQKPQRRMVPGQAPWARIVAARAVLASAAQALLRCATQVIAQLPTDTMNRLSPVGRPSSTITVPGTRESDDS